MSKRNNNLKICLSFGNLSLSMLTKFMLTKKHVLELTVPWESPLNAAEKRKDG